MNDKLIERLKAACEYRKQDTMFVHNGPNYQFVKINVLDVEAAITALRAAPRCPLRGRSHEPTR
jgi:hypothetical protein